MAPKPKKMSDADKAYLNRLLKAAKSGKGAMADGSLSNDQKMALSALKLQQKQATAYSPKPMSMRAADKAAARGKATQAKVTARKPKAGSAVVSKAAKTAAKVAGKVAKRVKVTAREARDIPTAVGGIRDVLENKTRTGAEGGKPRQLKNAIKNIAGQVKETGKAAATGKKGRPAQKYQTARGDNPSTFWTQPKRK